VVTSVTPSADEAGATIAIAGTDLGAAAWSSVPTEVGLARMSGGVAQLDVASLTACTTLVTNTAETSFTCTVPRATTSNSYSLYFKLRDGPVYAANSVLFNFATPVVTGISTVDAQTPLIPQAGGSTITIAGTYFSKVVGSTRSVTIDGVACTAVGYLAGSLTCTAPKGLKSNVPLVVTVDGLSSAPFTVSYVPPTVTGMNPAWSYSYPAGTGVVSYARPVITVTGTGFGTATGDIVSVVIGAVACVSPTWVNASAVQCTNVAANWPAAGASVVASVAIGSFAAVTGGTFTVYAQPVLQASSPGAQEAGGSVTLAGANLEAGGGAVSVPTELGFMKVVSGAAVTGTKFACTNAVTAVVAGASYTCTVPNIDSAALFAAYAQLSDGPLVVSPTVFAIAPPTVTAVSTTDPTSPSMPQAGGTLTLTGFNFSTLTGVSTVSVSVGATVCGSVVHASNTQIQCSVVAGTGPSYPLRVTVNGLQGPAFFVGYALPVVTAVMPGFSYKYANYNRTAVILGTGFGNSAADLVNATLGGVRCMPATRINATAISCVIRSTLISRSDASVAVTNFPQVVGGSFASPAGLSRILSVSPTAQQAGGTMSVTGADLALPTFSDVLAMGIVRCVNSVPQLATATPCTTTTVTTSGTDVDCVVPRSNVTWSYCVYASLTDGPTVYSSTALFAFARPVVTGIVTSDPDDSVSIPQPGANIRITGHELLVRRRERGDGHDRRPPLRQRRARVGHRADVRRAGRHGNQLRPGGHRGLVRVRGVQGGLPTAAHHRLLA
jgi:hypothetical protein